VSSPTVRSFRAADRTAVAEICLLTGNDGADATGLYRREKLIADVFALPYVDLMPDLDLVVDMGDHVAGYLLAVADTRAFVESYQKNWLPAFAAEYALVEPPATAEDRLIGIGYHPERMLISELEEFPAHLHIDLLPELQGKGYGRRLIRSLLATLGEMDVPGVHLGVSETNVGARAFYARLGFEPLPSSGPTSNLLGIRTDAKV
jgi:GNAT superfamily N-acetyltransferase